MTDELSRAEWAEATHVDPMELMDEVDRTPVTPTAIVPIRVEWVDGVGHRHHVYAENALTAISLTASLNLDTFVNGVLITAHDPAVRLVDIDMDTL
jgi:hypothetical protein